MEQKRLQLLLNKLMKKGKKETSLRLLNSLIDNLSLTTIDSAISNSNPYIKINRKPTPLTPHQQDSFSIHSLTQSKSLTHSIQSKANINK